MKIEHVAVHVKDPRKVAQWYVDQLGMRIVRAGGEPTYTHFLADEGNHVMIEIYYNAKAPVPDYAAMDPLVLHIAFSTDDLAQTRARLLVAGATAEGDVGTTAAGDELAMLRDPWGFAIQLARRRHPMI